LISKKKNTEENQDEVVLRYFMKRNEREIKINFILFFEQTQMKRWNIVFYRLFTN
jgi:hypothetical protein